ncbi:hypothetical protein [Massilia niastensis]|uniref:hypothetical protein n=1 Tax=Massilia niastensis TaxID=544911 RepID=UPI0004757802|nr:hypothetical protein [Massilia niastensis]
MRLPGTRYQEHGWEQVRKLLGQCSLQALGCVDVARLLDADTDATLVLYVEAVAASLHANAARGAQAGNSYGDTVLELALNLVAELQARPGDWTALCAALGGDHARNPHFWRQPGGEGLLRKKFNDLYAGLRDKVDSEAYQVACGRPCSPNRMYAYRMLDTAYHEIGRLFDGWREHAAQVGAILGRAIQAQPIEARQLRSIADCKAEWVMRWSESQERFGGAPGPLHTRSKRFASLKTGPARVEAMLREIGDYEQLSSNQDRDWLHEAGDVAAWLDDVQRVLDESVQATTPGPDQLLAAREDEFDADGAPDEAQAAPLDALEEARLAAVALRVSLPPGYIQSAACAQDRGSWVARHMADDSLPVRLAVYLRMLGPFDDSYPAAWLDPATGELPTMQQLAVLDDISLPTLRKRRDAAIARLHGSATKEKE